MTNLDLRRMDGVAMLVLCLVAIIWVTVSESIATAFELPRMALLAGLFLMIRRLFMKNIPSPTGSGAIIMALGIFINGAIVHFPLLNQHIARSFAVLLFLLLLFIAGSYLRDAMQGRMFELHFAHPVGSFAVGTWIAGISVCGITLCQRLPAWKPLVQFLVIGNIGLWSFFIYRATKNLGHLLTVESGRRVHGVLLLSTVSTQSLVIVWKAAFGESAGYQLLAPGVILLGVLFYLVGFVLIVRRYIGEGTTIDLDQDWFNTNCILHGAMSITGLAGAVCAAVPADYLLLIWLWVIGWFFLVEVVELARAVQRTKRYGFATGLLVYDPTQWSRNFTFGMLYAFTLHFDPAQSAAAGTVLLPLHAAILRYFAWVVLVLLLVEILVFFRDRLSSITPST